MKISKFGFLVIASPLFVSKSYRWTKPADIYFLKMILELDIFFVSLFIKFTQRQNYPVRQIKVERTKGSQKNRHFFMVLFIYGKKP